MADSLISYFDEGRLAKLDGLPNDCATCPHYASSHAADAWHVGHAYEARRPSVYGPSSVTHGRGYRINVTDGIGFPANRKAPRFVYAVAYLGHGRVDVQLVESK